MIPRRVAYVVGTFPKVSETFVASELAELRRRDIDVRILSLKRPTERVRHDIVTRAGLLERIFYDLDDFRDEMATFRPDLIHAHFATAPTAVARGLATTLDVPFTFTAHRYDIWDKPPSDLGERAAAAAAVVTVSHANILELTSRFRVDPARVRLIPCGIDTRLFRPARRPPDGPPSIVCLARMHPVKSLGLLLSACALLMRDHVAFDCTIVGDGAMREELLDLRGELGLDRVVAFPGACEQHDVARWWRRASVAALSSRSEGMPVSLMEAASSGIPAVATAVGGVPELIEHAVTGLVVPYGDPQAFAAALRTLLSDPARRERMGLAARARALARFSLERQVDDLVALWSEVLSREALAA